MRNRVNSNEWKYHEQEMFFHNPDQEVSILGYPTDELPITCPEKCDNCEREFQFTAFDMVIYDGPQFLFTAEYWVCLRCLQNAVHPSAIDHV